MTSEIILGIIIGILTSATQSIGLTLQRKSHLIASPRSAKIVFKLGLFLFIISNLIGSTIQIKTLPLIILSPLQSIGLIFNSVFASLILNESFTRINFVGTVLILIGALFIGYFNNLTDDSHLSNDEIFQLLGRGVFINWFLFVNIFVLLVIGLLTVSKSRSKSASEHYYLIRNFHCIRSVLFACYSGVLSSNSLLFAKISLELALNVIKTPHKLLDIKIWSMVAGFISMAVLQLVFLNKGLKHLSTSILYPLIFCVYNFINILNDLIFFDQSVNSRQLMFIFIGTLFVLFGVFLLSYTQEISIRREDTEAECQYGPVSSGGSDTNSEEEEERFTEYSQLVPKKKRALNGKRTLSFEQTELLSQLEQLKADGAE